jgi:hypothetical protein
MADVEISIRFGRKPGHDSAVILVVSDILNDNSPYEIASNGGFGRRSVRGLLGTSINTLFHSILPFSLANPGQE